MPDSSLITDTVEVDRTVESDGVELALIERGTGPLVIVLHGFPDSVFSMVPLTETLAAVGFRAVALALRGYAPSALPIGNRTTPVDLARDVLTVADALGEDRFSVVGHDWGAVAAHTVATMAPERVARIATAGVPHTHTVIMKPSFLQAWRSRYMVQFQVPGLPERLIQQHGLRRIDALVRRWSPSWDPTDEQLATIRRGLEGPGRARAAVGYYRGIPHVLSDPETRRICFGDVTVPTLLICGSDDHCMGPERFAEPSERFTGLVRVAEMDGCGHHMHLQEPEAFAAHVVEHLIAG